MTTPNAPSFAQALSDLNAVANAIEGEMVTLKAQVAKPVEDRDDAALSAAATAIESHVANLRVSLDAATGPVGAVLGAVPAAGQVLNAGAALAPANTGQQGVNDTGSANPTAVGATVSGDGTPVVLQTGGGGVPMGGAVNVAAPLGSVPNDTATQEQTQAQANTQTGATQAITPPAEAPVASQGTVPVGTLGSTPDQIAQDPSVSGAPLAEGSQTPDGTAVSPGAASGVGPDGAATATPSSTPSSDGTSTASAPSSADLSKASTSSPDSGSSTSSTSATATTTPGAETPTAAADASLAKAQSDGVANPDGTPASK
jgi:hypothetical protein